MDDDDEVGTRSVGCVCVCPHCLLIFLALPTLPTDLTASRTWCSHVNIQGVDIPRTVQFACSTVLQLGLEQALQQDVLCLLCACPASPGGTMWVKATCCSWQRSRTSPILGTFTSNAPMLSQYQHHYRQLMLICHIQIAMTQNFLMVKAIAQRSTCNK